ncbi:MAG: hydrogenase iron-sulfur subunit [Caldimicrobium thiodismutans]
MEEKGFKLSILCCNYTNLSEKEDFFEVPVSLEIKRYPCSGKIEITDMLRALREGAKGVMVAGCMPGTCHNGRGSERAEKRVLGARKILEEIGLEPERISMFFVNRLDGEDFINKVKAFYREILNFELKGRERK